MGRILVISKGIFHPTVFSRKQLRKIFTETDDIKFDFVSQFTLLDSIDNQKYQAVVLFFHEKNIAKSQLDSLISYVQNGGKLFCIHGALASFKNRDAYHELLGSKFLGHDKIQVIHITGKKEFVIKDELYRFSTTDKCNILLKSDETPVLWSKSENNGKVFCLSPGHRTSTFKNPIFKKLILDVIDEISEKRNFSEKT